MVSNHFSGDVSVIDGASNMVIDTIPVERYPWGDSTPTGVALAPDGRRAYVADDDSDAVSLIDLGG